MEGFFSFLNLLAASVIIMSWVGNEYSPRKISLEAYVVSLALPAINLAIMLFGHYLMAYVVLMLTPVAILISIFHLGHIIYVRVKTGYKYYKVKEAAEAIKASLETKVLKISQKTDEGGILLDSVTKKEVAQVLLEQEGISINRKKITFPETINKVGEHTAEIRLHTDVTAVLRLEIAGLMTKDIVFDAAEGRFNYRVGAIIIDSDKILMAKNVDNFTSFYYTVGGRVRLGESAEEAVLRESFEETQVRLEIDRLAYIHENFFVLESDSKFYHEISLFFLMKPNNALRACTEPGPFMENYGAVMLHWLPIKSLKNLQMYPEFFKTELINPQKGIKHFVTKDGNIYPKK
jgi:ribosomal protein L9